MKTKFFTLYLMCFGIFSCIHTDENINNVILFDNGDSLDSFDMGSITDSTFHIIPLETTNDNLISRIDKIEIRNNRIYIKDDLAKSIYIFDMNGKYVDKINAVGQGPGEYAMLSYMTVTDTSIIIVDNPTGKQIEYSLISLQPIKEKRIFDEIWCTDDIFTLHGAIYYINGWSESNIGKYRLFATNGDSYNKYLPFKKEPLGLTIHGPAYAINGNQASVTYSQDDVIYRVTDNNVESKYKIKFKNNKVEYYSKTTASVFDNPPGCVIGIDAINESDNYLFIDVSYTVDDKIPLDKGNYDIYTCLYNKSDSSKIVYPNSMVFNSNFDNEQIIIGRIINNQIICWRDAGILAIQKEYLYKDKVFKNKDYGVMLKNVLSNLTEQDNPVLFIYNLK